MKNVVMPPFPAHTPPPKSVEDLRNDLVSVGLLTSAEMQAIIQDIPVKTFEKGTLLLRAGQISTTCYSVIKGCVREFYLMDGEERTTEFYTEGNSLISTVGRMPGTPTKRYWECIEPATLSVYTYEKEKELYRRFPRLESFCRIEVEEKFSNYQEAMAIYMNSTPEERYLTLLKNRPDLLDRVPQYQLASYIGVKPESLSRIRGRIRAVSRQKYKRLF